MKVAKFVSIFLMLIMLSAVFVPAAMAQTDDNEKLLKNQKMEQMLKSTEVLKETEDEKIISFIAENNELVYGVMRKDIEEPNRVYFQIITSNDLASQKYVEEEVRPEMISDYAAASGFGNGSYVETYGNSITGGIHIYFSPRDAEIAFIGGGGILIVAANAVSFLVPDFHAIGTLGDRKSVV